MNIFPPCLVQLSPKVHGRTDLGASSCFERLWLPSSSSPSQEAHFSRVKAMRRIPSLQRSLRMRTGLQNPFIMSSKEEARVKERFVISDDHRKDRNSSLFLFPTLF